MEKVTILIGLELVFGPILKDIQLSDGTFSSGSTIVDNDEILNKLDKEVNNLWCTLFSKDEANNKGFKFDNGKEKELAPTLLKLINQIKKRLAEINDGSFEVHDMITDHLKTLI